MNYALRIEIVICILHKMRLFLDIYLSIIFFPYFLRAKIKTFLNFALSF